MAEPMVDASAAAAEKLARDFKQDVARCSSDASGFSDDGVESTTEAESGSDIDEITPLAHLRVLSTQFGREMEMYKENYSYQNHTILELRLSMINGIINHMTHSQKTLQESQEKVGRYLGDRIGAASHSEQLIKENQQLHGKIEVLQMVMARFESKIEILVKENRDLQRRLRSIANVSVKQTEPDTTTGRHKRKGDVQVAIHSDTEDRARKRAKRATVQTLKEV